MTDCRNRSHRSRDVGASETHSYSFHPRRSTRTGQKCGDQSKRWAPIIHNLSHLVRTRNLLKWKNSSRNEMASNGNQRHRASPSKLGINPVKKRHINQSKPTQETTAIHIETNDEPQWSDDDRRRWLIEMEVINQTEKIERERGRDYGRKSKRSPKSRENRTLTGTRGVGVTCCSCCSSSNSSISSSCCCQRTSCAVRQPGRGLFYCFFVCLLICLTLVGFYWVSWRSHQLSKARPSA